MEKENAREEALFRKFIANRCNPEEVEQVFACLKTSRYAKTVMQNLIAQELQQAARSGRGLAPGVSEYLRKRVFEQIEGPAHDPVLAKAPPVPQGTTAPVSPGANAPATGTTAPPPELAQNMASPVRKRSTRMFYWKIAAALTGVLMLGTAGYRYFIYQPLVRHQTRYGEITKLVLPDSSTVVLNGNSALRYAPDWERGVREVWLDGEAFFDVQHTGNDRKFIVHSSEGLDVEVLGTEFNVYDRADLTRIVLNTGKVKLNIKKNNTETSHVDMLPGELVELRENLEYEKREVDPRRYSSWVNGKVVLDNTSFREIVLLLEETYGLSVRVPDTTLFNERFSGTVPSENGEGLLKALALSFGLNIVAEGNNVTFKTKLAK